MAGRSKTRNPFYPVLVLVGLAFAITACAFAAMMVRGIHADSESASAAEGFMPLLQQYGFTALMIELAVLAIATCGAIATDEMWADRAGEPAKGDTPPPAAPPAVASGQSPGPPPASE